MKLLWYRVKESGRAALYVAGFVAWWYAPLIVIGLVVVGAAMLLLAVLTGRSIMRAVLGPPEDLAYAKWVDDQYMSRNGQVRDESKLPF